MRNFKTLISLIVAFILCYCNVDSVGKNKNTSTELSNPFTPEYLADNIRKDMPRLFLNKDIDKVLRGKLNSDTVVQNIYQTIKMNADEVMQKPFLERIKIDKRLLSVSREMLYRINMLGMVYHIEKDSKILERIDGEVKAVCGFSDWNSSHYLDVGEKPWPPDSSLFLYTLKTKN